MRVFGQVTHDPWSQEGQGGTLPIHGLKEGESRTLLFRYDEKDLAGTRRIKATDAGQVVVRLQPAAALRGRLLDDEGRPWRHAEITVRFFLKDRPGWIMDHFRLKVRTDADGKFRIDGLSPGVNYQAGVISSSLKPPRGVFTGLRLASGEMKDLGDVTPKKHDNRD